MGTEERMGKRIRDGKEGELDRVARRGKTCEGRKGRLGSDERGKLLIFL